MWSLVDVSGGSFGHWLVEGPGIFDWLEGLLRLTGVSLKKEKWGVLAIRMIYEMMKSYSRRKVPKKRVPVWK